MRTAVLRLGRKRIRWIFAFDHDFNLYTRFILPWALPNHERLAEDTEADFTVALYFEEGHIPPGFAELPGVKFLLASEVEARYPRLDHTWNFVTGPQPDDDLSYTRYVPILTHWCPPGEAPVKSRRCSTVEGLKYRWRHELVRRVATLLPDLDIFGSFGGRPLEGYHGIGAGPVGNDKYLALRDYAFCLAIERSCALDFLTDRFTDAILWDCVPIYFGAPNVLDYCIPECFIPGEQLEQFRWDDWRSIYSAKLPHVRRQREIVRTRLNPFSAFDYLTEDLGRLEPLRPLALGSVGRYP
jgi:hypothetical protein